MVKAAAGGDVLILCSDVALRESLADLLGAAGRQVRFDAVPGALPLPAVVVTAWDAWPAGWALPRLRASFARVPCLMLSGSPLAGDFAVAALPRGYFLRLPALPGQITTLVAELAGA